VRTDSPWKAAEKPKRLRFTFRGPSQIREIFDDHPLANNGRDSGKRHAILTLKVTEARVCGPYQRIPACEVEYLIGLEHPYGMSSWIKGKEICGRTVEVAGNSFPATVKL
jgi:hypothetical protein